jgi:hypothetical protein
LLGWLGNGVAGDPVACVKLNSFFVAGDSGVSCFALATGGAAVNSDGAFDFGEIVSSRFVDVVGPAAAAAD